MAVEIERKFLIDVARLPQAAGTLYVQGYLARDGDMTVRVRVAGDKGYLTIKAGKGISHAEFEYDIPVGEAREMLAFCKEAPIEKIRRVIAYEGHEWEVDEFLGANKGLWLAEIELAQEDEVFAKPEWLGREVSDDPRYYNANLAREPYAGWGDKVGE